ncbi:MAG: YidC/Oxa1 family membrane protein insertase [Ruminococcaceae bacterium]|nr:YidC/Oxa1 family membrane protein insertase [Oscillospiraceae bacterium]
MFSFIAKPFGWVLAQLYSLIGSYGVALIVFTIFAKLILLPFQIKSKKSTVAMQRIQPRLKELEKKYKNNKEAYATAVQKLYKEENVSMAGGCLPLLITLPIMLGLYAVVRQPLTYMFGVSAENIAKLAELVNVTVQGNVSNHEIQIASLLSQKAVEAQAIVPNLPIVDFSFLGINLAAVPSFARLDALWLIPLLSGLTSYAYSWMMKKKQPQMSGDQAAGMNGMMTYMMPLMSAYIAFIVPAGLGLYWIFNNILMFAQEPLLDLYIKKQEKGGTK